MSRPEINLGCLSWGVRPVFLRQGLLLAWSGPGLTVQGISGIYLILLPSTGITGMQHHTIFSKMVLGGKTQVLICLCGASTLQKSSHIIANLLLELKSTFR